MKMFEKMMNEPSVREGQIYVVPSMGLKFPEITALKKRETQRV
ncbi:MAG: hypothetical protein AAF203_06835 [Pseudomonadota bacterium]